MSAIERGTEVRVRTADGEFLPRRALSGVEMGSSFEIVWVCKEAEWKDANGRELLGTPWPAEAVEAVEALEPVKA